MVSGLRASFTIATEPPPDVQHLGRLAAVDQRLRPDANQERRRDRAAGLPWMGHAAGPTRMSRIETDKTILPHLPISTEERAGNLIRECVAHGTTHLRTHVDIDLDSGLAKLEGGRWLLMNASQA
jgi:hypothetical protein